MTRKKMKTRHRTNKVCSHCRKRKLLKHFRFRSERGTRRGQCILCENKLNTRHRRLNRRYQANERNNHLLRNYGVTLADIISLLRIQQYKCAICGKRLKAFGKINKVPTAYVDHCHNTGKIRGLLCNTCNQGIGFLKHSPELFVQAVRYLND